MSLLSPSTTAALVSNSIKHNYLKANPFPHVIIDDFLESSLASQIATEFPSYESQFLDEYSNQIEEKKLLNHWNKFGPSTYSTLSFLCSQRFSDILTDFTSSKALNADIGLHGAGIHMHSRGGKNNVHLDYSIHPKLGLQRKLNLIIYLTPDWDPSWNGSLGLYKGDKTQPTELVKEIIPKFNRAILFDVTGLSWHGLPDPITCPSSISRNSLALFYLQEPDQTADKKRVKATFSPAPWQIDDPEVLRTIQMRSNLGSASSIYLQDKV